MTRRHVPLMIVVLVGLSAWTGYAQAPRPAPARQLWEYRIVETQTVEGYTPAATIQQLLNQAGADGWEFVRVSDTRYYFKRAK